MANYWGKTLQHRMSRRRALMATGGAAAAAAFLAACGGDSDPASTGTATGTGTPSNGTGTGGSPNLLAQPVDTTGEAVRGGTLQSYLSREADHFDPQVGTAAHLQHAVHSYSRLLARQPGTFEESSDGSFLPDAATSWELSPDGMQVIVKLRPNNKLDERAPTNGRAITVDDVKFSFDRFSELSPNSGNVLNSVSPDMPVTGLSTPDDETVVLELAFPDSEVMGLLAWGWFLNIVPVEADGGFDIRQDMRGSGPWILTSYQPSQGWRYERNPNYWQADQVPFLDGIDYALINEPATLEAQFKTGSLWSFTSSADQVLPLKREIPHANLFSIPALNGAMRVMVPSKLPTSQLYTDVRLRHAMSMLLDRELFIETFGNISNFVREGIEIEHGWNGTAPYSWQSIWLDPQTDQLGEASKYFKYDPEEAAALLRAADAFGSQHDFAMFNAAPEWMQHTEVAAEMLQRDGHFRLNREIGDLASWYQPNYSRNQNQYEGIAAYQVFTGLPSWGMVMWNHTNPGARQDYISDWDHVPGLREVMLKYRTEADDQARVSLAHEWQKLVAEHMPYISLPQPGGTAPFQFAHQWFGNFGVYRPWDSTAQAADEYIYYWHDESKRSS